MLTPEQVQSVRKQVGIQAPTGSDPVNSRLAEFDAFAATLPKPKPTLKEKFAERVDKASTAQEKAITGEQTNASAALQTIGQGAAFVGDVALEGIKKVTPDFIERGVEKGISKIAETKPVQDVAARYGEWKTRHPEAAANLEAVTNIAGVLPGVRAGAKVVEKAGAKTVKAAGEATAATGRATKAAGGALYKTAVTPTTKEAERILNYKASAPFLSRAANVIVGKETPGKPNTAAETALESGFMGRQSDLGIQAKRHADVLWNEKIEPAVSKSPATLTKEDLFSPIEARISNTTEPAKRQAYLDAYEALKKDYQAFPELFSLSEAQKLKIGLDEFTPEKLFKGKNVANEYRVLQHDMADAIRGKTYDLLDNENIKKAYLDYSNLYELQKIGVKAISEQGLKAGFGTFWSTMWDMATTPIKTIGGQVVYRVGKFFEFVGDKGIKKFGEYLEKSGMERPNSSTPQQ